jgi:hypothetical protein
MKPADKAHILSLLPKLNKINALDVLERTCNVAETFHALRFQIIWLNFTLKGF